MLGKTVLILALVGYTAAALDTCAKGGEYCLNHWDCCSNSCLSFLYKCSHIQAPSPAIPIFAQPPTSSYDVEPISLTNLIEYVFKSVESDRNSIRSRDKVTTRFYRQIPASQGTQYSQPSTSGPPGCKEIGEKCYADAECCTSRCHGFLHQCVT